MRWIQTKCSLWRKGTVTRLRSQLTEDCINVLPRKEVTYALKILPRRWFSSR
jgi:hypothetical protein